MLRHNFLIIFRNLKRNKSSFLINLFRLPSGLACALRIFLRYTPKDAEKETIDGMGKLFKSFNPWFVFDYSFLSDEIPIARERY